MFVLLQKQKLIYIYSFDLLNVSSMKSWTIFGNITFSVAAQPENRVAASCLYFSATTLNLFHGTSNQLGCYALTAETVVDKGVVDGKDPWTGFGKRHLTQFLAVIK